MADDSIYSNIDLLEFMHQKIVGEQMKVVSSAAINKDCGLYILRDVYAPYYTIKLYEITNNQVRPMTDGNLFTYKYASGV